MANFAVTNTSEEVSNLTMNLFGIPHQFPDAVDPRVKSISSTIGRNFSQNILHEGPVLTVIPGKPKYLSSEKSKETKKNTTVALLMASSMGQSEPLKAIQEKNLVEYMRLYDFQRDFTDYMQYVNILCRAGATFLDLKDTISANGQEYSFQNFDWRNYKYNKDAQQSFFEKVKENVKGTKNGNPTPKDYSGMTKKERKAAEKAAKLKEKEQKGKNKTYEANLSTNTTTAGKFDFKFETEDVEDEGTFLDNFTNYNYVQFYVDPESGQTDTMTNTTGESSLKGMLNSNQNTFKDIAFMANSGGVNAENVEDMVGNSATEITEGVESVLGSINTTAGTIFERIGGIASRVIKGENIIIPDIYQSSSYGKQYTVTVHLRSPYGSKLGYYLNIYVPLMHLLALALPKQATANSYAAPFLVKGYLEGMWTINLGLVTDITITKDTETLSVDGLPMAVDVTLTLQDLYADLSMTPADKPLLFLNNSSLIEYLATTCGMSLSKPNLQKKYELLVNSVKSAFTDILPTVKSQVNEALDNILSNVTSLY